MDTLCKMLGLNREADWEIMRQAFIARKKQLQQQMLAPQPEEARAAADALTALVRAYAEAKKQAEMTDALPSVPPADKTVSQKEEPPADRAAQSRKLQAGPSYTVPAAGPGKVREKQRRPGRSLFQYWQSGKVAFQSAGKAWQIAGGLLGAAVIVLVGYAGYIAVPNSTAEPRKMSKEEVQALLPGENEFEVNYAERALFIVNLLRKGQNVKTLRMAQDLNEAADIRAQELAEKYSSDRPDGSAPWRMLGEEKEKHIRGQYISQSQNERNADEFIFSAWKGNGRNQMMRDQYTQLGVGHYYDANADTLPGYRSKDFWVLLYR